MRKSYNYIIIVSIELVGDYALTACKWTPNILVIKIIDTLVFNVLFY